MSKIYDFIVVGGGSAGCVLANRLSEDPSNSVLVLEAGGTDHWWDLRIHMPAGLTMPIGNPNLDWCYKSEPEPYMNGRRIEHPRGKVLGGSSSINGMIFQRGNPMDYERWGEIKGLEKWSYKYCLPYFKKMEALQQFSSEYRGDKGPLHLERGDGNNPLCKQFLLAAEQAGYPIIEDLNGHRQEGFSHFDRNIKNGRRWSSARAYYHPIKNRNNLAVVTKCFTTELIWEKNTIVGVRALLKGKEVTYLGSQIIICSGAINTPKLLMLSGIGPENHLQDMDIPVRIPLAGVGENLQDHLEVYVQYRCRKKVSMNPAMLWYNKPWVGLQWLFRKGPAATNHFEVGGFIRSREDIEYPNLMFHFLPLAVRYDGSSPIRGHGYQVHVGPMYSNSRGTLRLQSKNPADSPRLKFNYLSTKEDRQEWIEAITIARDILGQPALEQYNDGEISPGPSIQSPEEILQWVAKEAETALHPSCTCKMGIDSLSVVDPETLKVHGVDNLRVVDASILPTITNGNIYAPVMMVAEKASDIILEKQQLAPLHLNYFRNNEYQTEHYK